MNLLGQQPLGVQDLLASAAAPAPTALCSHPAVLGQAMPDAERWPWLDLLSSIHALVYHERDAPAFTPASTDAASDQWCLLELLESRFAPQCPNGRRSRIIGPTPERRSAWHALTFWRHKSLTFQGLAAA
jgi:hypothetical protein